jgi:hypothetical protein
VDNDGVPNGADLNIDGGIAKSGPLKGQYIGDRIANDNAAELDMDADGLLDNAASETDIDGDGLADNSKLELDIDGDGRANGLDGDLDGDGLVNNSDADMYGTGDINDIFQLPGSEEAYAADASVASTLAYVSGQIRQKLQIPATDKGLRVRVNPVLAGSLVTGVWRYLSSDNIQVWAKWAYSASDPSRLYLAVQWSYSGPTVTIDQIISGDVADYLNPANYSISEESRVYSSFPGGSGTNVSWLPQQPASFYSIVASEQATGFAPPYEKLRAALRSYPNFSSSEEYLNFSGDLSSSPGLPSLQPLINLQRTIMQVSRAWYGQLEAQQLR